LFCNGNEFCDEGNDQCASSGDPCSDDGLWCNGEESCNEGQDDCEQLNVPNCDDSIPCTVDSCDEDLDQCENDTGECTAVLLPECPDETPTSAFDLPIIITEVDGEDNIGFSLTFDNAILTFVDFSTTGTVLEDWTVTCELDPVETYKVICTGSSDTPLEPGTDITLVNLTFDFPAAKGGAIGIPIFVEANINNFNDVRSSVDYDVTFINLPLIQPMAIGSDESNAEEKSTSSDFETLELTEDFQYFSGDTCSIDFPDDDDDDDDNDDDTTDDDDDNDDDNDDDSDDDDTGDDDETDDDDGGSSSGGGDDDDSEGGCGF